jgi:type IV pilus assembly protein PilZ
VPFETAVRLRFDRFHGFVEQYSANLSLGGMFIKSDELPPLGTEVAVEFHLEDGFELIRGRGRVAWVREPAEGDDPAGFGLRFLELTPGSRELIFRLVERRVREGDRVFDLEESAPQTVAGRLVHDEEHLGSPPWDLPAPRGGEEAARGEGGAAGGGATLYGRAAREVAEEEPRAGAHLAAVREEEPPAAADPEASFAGLVEVDEEEGGERLASIGEAETMGGAAGGAAGAAAAASAGAVEGAADAEETASPAAFDSPEHDEAETGEPRFPGDSFTGDRAAAGAAGPAFGAGWPAGRTGSSTSDDATADGGEPWSEASEPAETTAHGYAGAGRAGGSGRRGRLLAAIAAVVVVLAAGGFLLFRALASSQDGAGSAATAAPAATVGGPADADAAGTADSDATAAPDGADRQAANPPTPPAEESGEELAAPPPPADGPRTVERIDWRRRDGGLDFEISGGRPIAAGQVDHFRVGGERPRLVVRIAGIERPYARGEVAVGGPLVERVRTGFHPAAGAAGGSLHVVFDLASAGAEAAVDAAGDGVRVRIEGP